MEENRNGVRPPFLQFSTLGSQAATNTVNGDRKGLSSGWWADDTSSAYPDWVQVDFSGSKTINEIDVIGLQQNYSNPVEPTLTMTSSYALTNFEVQYWTGSAWATVPNGSITGNDEVWKKFTFSSITTSKIRVYVTNVAGDNRSQVVEVEAWTASGDSSANVKWLVADHLGTPRMVFDQSGSLSNVSRHDYLPFGEELFAGVGGRTTGQGYTASDGTRQMFTGYESDHETGLNFAQARYHSPAQGRFTSVDPFAGSANVADPQSFNRYSYVQNNPVNFIDPTGMMLSDIGVYQTDDPELARTLQLRADLDHLKTNQAQASTTPSSPSGSNTGSEGGSVVGVVTIYGQFTDNWGNPDYAAMNAALLGLARNGMRFGASQGVLSRSSARNFLAGVIDYGVGPPPIPALFGTTWGHGIRLGVDWLAESYANEESTAYYAGSWVPDAVAAIASGGATTHERVMLQGTGWLKNNVFRWGRQSFKVRGQYLQNQLHFHLGPGKGLMLHHLPHEFCGWRGNLWNNLKKWKW